MPEPDPSALQSAAPLPTTRWRGRLADLALVALVLGLGVALGLIASGLRTAGRTDDDRQEALAAARQQAVNLTSIDHRTAATDIDRILAGSTGELAAQFRKEKQPLVTLLGTTQSRSQGEVLDAGVVSLNARTAEVLVAVDANVNNVETQMAGKGGLLNRYRMSLSLVRVGSGWLVEQVRFAGPPS